MNMNPRHLHFLSPTEIATLTHKFSSVTLYRNKTVRYAARMHAIIACQMEFQLYPMDIQICPIYIESCKWCQNKWMFLVVAYSHSFIQLTVIIISHPSFLHKSKGALEMVRLGRNTKPRPKTLAIQTGPLRAGRERRLYAGKGGQLLTPHSLFTIRATNPSHTNVCTVRPRRHALVVQLLAGLGRDTGSGHAPRHVHADASDHVHGPRHSSSGGLRQGARPLDGRLHDVCLLGPRRIRYRQSAGRAIPIPIV